MLHQTYYLHKIVEDNEFGFSPSDYSRFKFGDDTVAKHFGTALANGFIQDVLSQGIADRQMVVISSPYSFIPTATFAMKNYFVFRLNRWLAAQNLPVVQETRVHRTITYKEDYGALNAAERMSLIGNDRFHIDAAFVKDKVLLFLDDIKITGSHERMITKMIEQFGLSNDVYMLYFAALDNDTIHPNIENYLNYYEVKSIFDLDDIVNGNGFSINTRVVKYILNYDHNSFCMFINSQPEEFVNNLYDMALGNGYHNMDSYSINLNYVKEHLFTKNQKLIKNGN